MKRQIYYFILLLIIVSCNTKNNSFKTDDKTGLKYQFFVNSENAEQPKPDDILVVNMRYRTEDDSILFDTKEIDKGFRMKVGTDKYEGGSLDDAFTMMHVGDSARFLIDAVLFYTNTRKMDVPEFIKPGSKLIFDIKLIEIFNFEKYQEERRKVDVPSKVEEMKLLESYLKNANITDKPSKSGLYYIETLKGKGKTPLKGKRVKVHYTGTLIDGRVFDSSLDRNEPFEFTLGKGEVIQGWDEGIANMRVGGKATLIIPSDLAYGDKTNGRILPFSTLIFEVELLEIN